MLYKTGYREKGGGPAKRGPPGLGFKLTTDGNYDMQQRALENVRMSEKDDSVATKKYVDNVFNSDVDLKRHKIVNLEQQGANAVNSKYVEKTFLKITDHGKNLRDPVSDTDAATKKYIDSKHGKNVPKPTKKDDAVNLDYVSSNYLSKSQHGKNLPEPTSNTDAVTKAFADKTYLDKKQAFNYDCRGRRLQNVGNAEDDLDAVNMQQTYEIIKEYINDLNLVTTDNIEQHAPAQKIYFEMLEEQRARFHVIEAELKRVADIAERCSKTMGIVVDKNNSINIE